MSKFEWDARFEDYSMEQLEKLLDYMAAESDHIMLPEDREKILKKLEKTKGASARTVAECIEAWEEEQKKRWLEETDCAKGLKRELPVPKTIKTRNKKLGM